MARVHCAASRLWEACSRYAVKSTLSSVVLHALQDNGKGARDWQGEMRRRQVSDKIKKGLPLEKRAGVDVLWAVRSFSSLEYTKLGWKPPGRVPEKG